MKDSDLVLAKADKGNSVVLLNNCDYTTKVETFRRENNAAIDKKFNINDYRSATKALIEKSKNVIPARSRKYLIEGSMNPSTPQLYGSMKVHKAGDPIRPIVSY